MAKKGETKPKTQPEVKETTEKNKVSELSPQGRRVRYHAPRS